MKETKEIFYTLLIFLLVVLAYFGLKFFIDYSIESSRKPQPTSPTYGTIDTNELA